MDLPLIVAGLAMGAASSPHCALMCGAPCAALTSGCARNAAGFHLGRVIGYMAGGYVAAMSVAAIGTWAQAAPALRPLWMLLHLGFLALGLWWLATGSQPDWMKRNAAVPVRIFVRQAHDDRAPSTGSVGARKLPLRAGLAGLAWVAWPCGALQAALLLAALASDAQVGALVMAAFALASMPALAVAPWAWRHWQVLRGGAAAAGELATLGYRVAGLSLVVASGWVLTHGLWERVAAWCA
ncbi:MAG TPA: sulfite exporter TauE/SafE family protein [Albitalea sp.]|nr:sulfite exporter TauE/SafE family protein [Albitalea sp.]